jgi:PTH1 family peptidyl-tRNA hydrolase
MLIVGLGNPGPAYAGNRHNIGFMVIEELVKRFDASKLSSSSFNGELFKFSNNFLLKPLTYMNLSGNSILAVKKFYKVDEVVVIHDDLDLPFGTLRFKRGGGHGGHNGLKSADQMISRDYARVRLGIGKPEHKAQVASYVLSDFSSAESEHIATWISHTCEAIESLLENSLEDVSSKYTIKKFQLK